MSYWNKAYDKWMDFRGYEPYGFDFKTGKHIYEKKENIVRWEYEVRNEGHPDFEVIDKNEEAPKFFRYKEHSYVRLDVHNAVINKLKKDNQ